MDQATLVSEQIEAGRDFLRRLDATVLPVKTAFWIKEPDRRYWRLYIASDKIDDANQRVGLNEVARVAQEMRDPEIDPFRIRVIPGNKKVITAVLELQSFYPGKPIRRGDIPLGDIYAEAVYIYPSPLPAAATTP